MSERSALAVIIGRAGSKGLPGKNAMPIGGAPMIAHSIRHAQQSKTIGRIIVSTDGQMIADAATAAGAEVIMRPASLATDSATVDDAVRHAVLASGDVRDIIVILYANIPVRPPDLIDRAVVELHAHPEAQSVQSYSDVGKHHPWWMAQLEGVSDSVRAGRVQAYHPNAVYRRQDLPPLFLPDGGVIAVRRESLFTVVEGQPHAFLGEHRRGIVNPSGAVVDVDTPLDFTVAEAMLQREARNR
ncbi:MAG TPA: acylneuraminate cytidylyltransferase family protein [Phycisphaerales bacterium]|nr:acylneuraminate cytidylyltransferase family protein [Phycisphaerales bacterium]